MPTILPHMVGLSANLRCRSETHGSLKCRTQKVAKKSPSRHPRTTLSGYIFGSKRRIDNRKNRFKQQYLLHTFYQYGELQPTSGWDRFTSLGHPCKFQRVSRLGSVNPNPNPNPSGRQSNFAALNRRRHLYLAGRPPRWAFAHILVSHKLSFAFYHFCMRLSHSISYAIRPKNTLLYRLAFYSDCYFIQFHWRALKHPVLHSRCCYWYSTNKFRRSIRIWICDFLVIKFR